MREGSISFEKGVSTYDRDAAVKSGESEEILKIADIAFAYLQKSMDNRKDMSKKQGENIKKPSLQYTFRFTGIGAVRDMEAEPLLTL